MSGGSPTLGGSFNFMIGHGTYSIADAYWLVGGTGAALIGLYWMESQGWITVRDSWVKTSMILIYAFVVGWYILKGSFWGLLL